MPIYVYECECGEKFDELHHVDTPATLCPKCGRIANRILAPVNFSFGWRLSDASHIKGNKDELVPDR